MQFLFEREDLAGPVNLAAPRPVPHPDFMAGDLVAQSRAKAAYTMISSSPADRRTDVPTWNHLILFDGVCCLCNRLIQFVMRRDKAQVFRFASLQSPLGQSLTGRHGEAPGKLDTVVVIANYGSSSARLLSKASAGLFVLQTLGGPWRLASVLRVLPDRLLDWFYDLVARYRYRIFGRYQSCPMPTPEQKSRFLG